MGIYEKSVNEKVARATRAIIIAIERYKKSIGNTWMRLGSIDMDSKPQLSYIPRLPVGSTVYCKPR